VVDSCENVNELSGSIKHGEFLAPQEGFCSMELVVYPV
jgi:hypothetical protein